MSEIKELSKEELDAKILAWLDASEKLSHFKDLEMSLRKELAKIVLKSDRIAAFSETLDLGKGYKLKATQKINYKLDSVERVTEVIDKLTDMNEVEVSSTVFKWKPELSETNYKKLEPAIKLIVDEVVSCNVGAPTLEFKEPKKKEEVAMPKGPENL